MTAPHQQISSEPLDVRWLRACQELPEIRRLAKDTARLLEALAHTAEAPEIAALARSIARAATEGAGT